MQAASLCKSAATLTAWAQSPYGKIFVFSDQRTLDAVRSIWSWYHDRRGHHNAKANFVRFVDLTQTGLDASSKSFGGSRGTGIFAHLAEAAFVQCGLHYWKRGVALEEHDFEGDERINFVNPTLLFSSATKNDRDVFLLSPGANYLSAYHIAGAVDDGMTTLAMMQSLTSCAKAEFAAWCQAIVCVLGTQHLSFLVHVGDAIPFAYKIQSLQSPEGVAFQPFQRVSVSPSKQTLSFGNRAVEMLQSGFDVVDAAFLTDRAGILVILPAMVPLLRPSPLSVLYTETRYMDSTNFCDFLELILRIPVSAAAVFTGVCPASHLSGVTSEFSLWDVTLRDKSVSPSRVQIAWRLLHLHMASEATLKTRKLAIDPESMAKFFARWFHAIFFCDKDEMTAARKQFVKPGRKQAHLYSKRTAHSKVNYCGSVLLDLLELAFSHVITDKTLCVRNLAHCFHTDASLGHLKPVLQELQILLFLAGLQPLPPSIEKIQYLVLVVPRTQLEQAAIDRMNLNKVSLVVKTILENGEKHLFSTLHAVFGKLIMSATQNSAIIEVDPGDGDLLLICPMSSAALQSVHTAFVVAVQTQTFKILSAGGTMHTLAERKLNDGQTFVLHDLPGTGQRDASELSGLVSNLDISQPSDPGTVTSRIKFDGAQSVASMTFEYDLPLKADGQPKVDFKRVSPFLLAIRIRKWSQTMHFPYPLGKIQCHTHFQDESMNIKISGVPVLVYDSATYKRNTFPVIRQGDQVIALSVGYLPAQVQPRVTARSARRAAVAQTHSLLSITGSACGESPVPMPDVMYHGGLFVEKLLCPLVCADFRLQSVNWTCYSLFNSAKDDPNCVAGAKMSDGWILKQLRLDSLLVVHAVKHDQHGGAIFLDGYLITLAPTQDPMEKVMALQKKCEMDQVVLEEAEFGYFKNLMPSAVERCRRGWKHNKTCRYQAAGATIPLTTENGASPVCSCGMGKDTDDLPPIIAAPFGHLATRVAIPLLFQPPYHSGQAYGTLHTGMTVHGREIYENLAGSDDRIYVKRCAYCRKTAARLDACGGCGQVGYCSANCRRLDQGFHQRHCEEFRPRPQEAVSGGLVDVARLTSIPPIRRFGWV